MKDYGPWTLEKNKADFGILNGSPIPSKLMNASAGEIREWLDSWLLAYGMGGIRSLTFEDRRHGALGTVGYLDGEEWVAAVGFTGGRMLLPEGE